MNRVDRTRRESGFTIVEVLVAVFVLLAVASAIAMATVGGNKLRGTARLQVSMTGAGNKIQEDIATDRSWMRSCTTTCNVAGIIDAGSRSLEDVDGTVTVLTATARALDSEVDGLEPNDADGLVPDYYRLRIVIQPAADVAARYGTTPARAERTIVTTIDRRGDIALGSIAIEVCRVMNQSDERMSIQGCERSGISSIREADCAPTATACRSVFSWVAAQAPSTTERSPFVVMSRVPASSLNIRLRSATGWSAGMSAARVGSDGRLLFDDVPAGEVFIDGIPSTYGGGERWMTKEQPAFLGSPAAAGSAVMVEPGVRSRALALFRPTKTNGVSLYFERRTRTFHLTGPKSGHNVVVRPWARTHTYEGVQAERICDAYGGAGGDVRFNSMWCEPPAEPGPGRNCVTVYGGMHEYVLDPTGNYFIDEGMLGVIDDEAEREFIPPEIIRRQITHNHVKLATTCTWYWEEYFTTYYSHGNTTTLVRPGIVEPITYSMEPMPTFRYVEINGSNVRSVVPQCRVPRRSQCGGGTGAYPDSLGSFVPGLNTGLRPSNDGTGTLSPAAAEAVNTRWGVTPSGAWSTLRSNALWVRTNGSIVGSNGGTVAPGTRLTARGEGECYWRSPLFSGEHEGVCDPCQPLYQPNRIVQGCALLTRVEWKRHAKETVTYYPTPVFPARIGWDPQEYPIAGAADTINFNPPYQCRSAPPVVIGGCSPQATGGGGGGGGGGPRVPPTTHPSPQSGGEGGVAGHAVTQPPTA